MPKQNKSTAIAQRTGRDLLVGKNRPEPGRARGTREKNSPSIIADSFHSLTLKLKRGAEIYFKMDKSARFDLHDGDDVEKIYHDLYRCFRQAADLLAIPKTEYINIRQYGMTLGSSLDYLLRKFEERILPQGFEYNIEKRHPDEYFFVIYKECGVPEGCKPSGYWGNYWHHLQLKHVCVYLKKNNPKLLDLFIKFIHAFRVKTQIDPWWGDTMCYCEDWLEEEIFNFQEQIDDPAEALSGKDKSDEAVAYKWNLEALNDYRAGLPFQYRHMICKGPVPKAAAILRQAKRMKRDEEILKMIIDGCELISDEFNIQYFCYQHDEDTDGYDSPSLRFENQSAIIWDFNDAYTSKQIEANDANANEGIYPPIVWWAIHPNTKEFNIDKMKRAEAWLYKLEKFFQYAQPKLNSYERKNKRAHR